MKTLDLEKTIKYFEDIMEENEKHIENDNDADLACYHENETLDFVIRTLKNERFYK